MDLSVPTAVEPSRGVRLLPLLLAVGGFIALWWFTAASAQAAGPEGDGHDLQPLGAVVSSVTSTAAPAVQHSTPVAHAVRTVRAALPSRSVTAHPPVARTLRSVHEGVTTTVTTIGTARSVVQDVAQRAQRDVLVSSVLARSEALLSTAQRTAETALPLHSSAAAAAPAASQTRGRSPSSPSSDAVDGPQDTASQATGPADHISALRTDEVGSPAPEQPGTPTLPSTPAAPASPATDAGPQASAATEPSRAGAATDPSSATALPAEPLLRLDDPAHEPGHSPD